jgi:hypothetical protein
MAFSTTWVLWAGEKPPMTPPTTKDQEEEKNMANRKKSMAIGLVVCLLQLCLADAGLATSPTRVAYDEVTEQREAKVTHNGKEQPDAAKMKRVAERLGVGHHVMVKTAGAR